MGLAEASDRDVWEFARVQEFLLVSKDADFVDLSVLLGAPPKVIWLQTGNCSTDRIERVLRDHYSDIEVFEAAPNFRVLRLR